MPFVQGKCESCGGILTVDPSLKAAICPFCGSAYVVQDSINYYNTTVKVENMHADVVNISDESSSEGRLKAAEAYMKIKKYAQAENEYRKVVELTPQNHLGWLGLIESHSHCYSLRIKSSSELMKLEDYSKSVLAFAPNGTGEGLVTSCKEYISNEKKKNNAELEPLFDKESAYKEQRIELNSIDDELNNKLQGLYSRRNYLLNQANNISNQDPKKKGKGSVGAFATGITLIIIGWIACAIGFIAFGVILIIIGVLLFSSIFWPAIRIGKINSKISTLNREINDIECERSVVIAKRKKVEKESLANKYVIDQYK